MERSGKVVTLLDQERLGTFESRRSNALEPIVENVHGMARFTLQKRKNHCNIYGDLETRSSQNEILIGIFILRFLENDKKIHQLNVNYAFGKKTKGNIRSL
jgi:hypothetical protein